MSSSIFLKCYIKLSNLINDVKDKSNYPFILFRLVINSLNGSKF